MKKNKKKTVIAVISIALTAIFTACVVFALSIGDSAVKVAPVSTLNQGYWNGNSQIMDYGTVNASMNQIIYYDESLTVKEIYVKAGDDVKAGDPLISYDTTLAEMEYDMKKMQIEGIELKIKNLQAEIEQLKVTTASVPAYTSSASTMLKINPIKHNNFSQDIFIKKLNSKKSNTIPDNNENFLPEGQVYNEISESSLPYTGNGTKENPYRYYVFPPDEKNNVNLTDGWIKKALAERSINIFDTVDNEENPNKIISSWEINFETLSAIAGNSNIGTEFPPELADKEIHESISELSAAYNYDTADGTTENPYKFLCAPGVSVNGNFMSEIIENGYVAVFSVVDNKDNPQKILYSWTMDGINGTSQEPSEPELPDIPTEPAEEEINRQIKEKEDSIKSLNLEKRNCELELKKLEQKVKGGVIKSTINGKVKTVNEAEKAKLDGSPLISVIGEEGIYVTGAVAETFLAEIQSGMEITVKSWETGETRQAKITGVGQTPLKETSYRGNPNMSYYPFSAVISEEANFKNGESVSISADGFAASYESSDKIYLMQAFVREDENGFYVYKKDNNKLLKKQYVTVVRITDGLMEIDSGISTDDEIAFPYGKNVKDGAKTNSVETLFEY